MLLFKYAITTHATRQLEGVLMWHSSNIKTVNTSASHLILRGGWVISGGSEITTATV